MKLDWGFVVIVALVTIGFLQWLKALVKALPPKPGETTVPSLVWAIVMPILSALFAYLFTVFDPWVAYAATGFAVSQLGYDNIIQLVKKKIDQAGGG